MTLEFHLFLFSIQFASWSLLEQNSEHLISEQRIRLSITSGHVKINSKLILTDLLFIIFLSLELRIFYLLFHHFFFKSHLLHSKMHTTSVVAKTLLDKIVVFFCFWFVYNCRYPRIYTFIYIFIYNMYILYIYMNLCNYKSLQYYYGIYLFFFFIRIGCVP